MLLHLNAFIDKWDILIYPTKNLFYSNVIFLHETETTEEIIKIKLCNI